MVKPIQTVKDETAYERLLPLYLAALAGLDDDHPQAGSIRSELYQMARAADRWRKSPYTPEVE
jgi:hypothetical protein